MKDFRRFMLAMVFFTGAIHMGGVAQGWLVNELTGSSLALGIVGSLFSIMILFFSPLGGVLADRVEKKLILLLTWVATAGIFGVLALLIISGRIEMWHLFAASIAQGLVFSFNITSRFGLISQLVRDGLLKNATSMVALTFNINGLLFPLLGGAVIDLIGVGGAYVVITLLYVASAVLVTRVPRQGELPRQTRSSLVKDFVIGFRFLRGQPVLLGLTCLALSSVALGQPYLVLLPKMATETFGVKGFGLGLLIGAGGFGGIAGNLILAGLRNDLRLGRLAIAMGMATGIGLVLLALSSNMVLGVILLALLGLTSLPAFTIIESLLQRHTPPEMRGRVMSLYMMVWGLFPVGVLLSSALADAVGLWLPLVIDGVGMAAVALLAIKAFPGLLTLTAREDLPLPTGKK